MELDLSRESKSRNKQLWSTGCPRGSSQDQVQAQDQSKKACFQDHKQSIHNLQRDKTGHEWWKESEVASLAKLINKDVKWEIKEMKY